MSPTTELLDIPQYTIGTMSSGQNTQYIQYIYKYIGLQLDFQKWYYLLYLPNELKRIFGFVTKACFFQVKSKVDIFPQFGLSPPSILPIDQF